MRWLTTGILASMLCGCQSGAGSSQDRDPYLAMDTLLVANACSNCHAADYQRVGPSMRDVAAAVDDPQRLIGSILNGRKEGWGAAVMPPQHQVNSEQARALAEAILALKSAPPRQQ
jgi:cytochrome c551/c552